MVILHGFLFAIIVYKIMHFFIYRFLVYDLGMSFGLGELITFCIVAVLGTLLFHHNRYKRYY